MSKILPLLARLLLPVLLPFGVTAEEPEIATDFPTVTVEYHEIQAERTVDAVVEAVNQSTVAAQTSGQVTEVMFDVDDVVQKGDVLVRVKNTEQRAGLKQAEAQLQEAVARNKQANDEYKRVSQMHAKQAMSQSALDSAKAELAATQARMDAARAELQKAKEHMDYTEITAPYSGVVVQRLVQPGEMATPGKPLMTGLSLEQLRAVAQVPQSLVEAVRRHQQARVVLNDGRDLASGAITIVPYADPQTHTFKVRLDLPPNSAGVYPGMFVKVAFVIGQERRLLVPAQAVAFRGEVRAVYVVGEAGKLSMRQVRLGKTYGDQVEVLAGLEAGETLSTDPVKATVLLKRHFHTGEQP